MVRRVRVDDHAPQLLVFLGLKNRLKHGLVIGAEDAGQNGIVGEELGKSLSHLLEGFLQAGGYMRCAISWKVLLLGVIDELGRPEMRQRVGDLKESERVVKIKGNVCHPV